MKNYAFTPQHFLYFFPDPQGHGSFRPILTPSRFYVVFPALLMSPRERVTRLGLIKEGENVIVVPPRPDARPQLPPKPGASRP